MKNELLDLLPGRAIQLGVGLMADAVWFCVPSGRNRFDGDRQAVIFNSAQEAQDFVESARAAGRTVWDQAR